jgi:DNA polymerase-1
MVQLQDALQHQGLPAQLLLQVHDELVLEVAPDALEATRELVVQTMEQAVELSVPLVVETGVGANWMEAK